jgi:hypothetical protein
MKRSVEFRHQYGTARNIANSVRRRAIEANSACLPVELYLSPPAITELIGVSDLNLVRPVDSGYSLDRIAHETCFRLELRCVGEVLKLTTSAFAEVLARRLAPRRRGLQYLIDHSAREVFLSLSDPNPESLSGCGEWNEHGEPVVSSYGVAAVSEPFGAQIYDVAHGE